MDNLFARFGNGPASALGASGSNWSSVYTGPAAQSGTAGIANTA
jgi:hypothetical protein